jgi:hypothetical protein
VESTGAGQQPARDNQRQVIPEALPEIPTGDSWASREVAALAEGKLNRFKRDDRLHAHMHNASICFVWLYFIAMGVMGAVWLWHLVMPERWDFLTDPQRDKLETAFFAAVGSSALTDRAKRIGQSSSESQKDLSDPQ